MKEVKQFLKDIEANSNGYKLGDPWKFSKHALGVIVPILRTDITKRNYITLPEVKDKVKFTDIGSIQNISIKGLDDNLFIRAGTILEGIGTQSRGVTHSIIIEPKIEVNLDVRCIHASHGISHGSNFKYQGYAPQMVTKALHRGNQNAVWGNVGHCYMAMSDFSLSMDRGTSSSLIGSVQQDNLPQIKKAMNKLDSKLQSILKEVPVLENQIGAIIVGVDGVEGIETFDHPDSWKAQYKEVIETYSETLAEESKKLFTFDDSAINQTIKDFFEQLSKANSKEISKHTFQIELKGFIGEYVTLDNHLVHMFLMEDDEVNQYQKETIPTSNRPRRYVDPIQQESEIFGTAVIGRQQNNRSSYQWQSLKSELKPGYSKMIDAIDQHGGATWTELEKAFTSTKSSSATLAKRIKGGKAVGMIGETLRKDGKKVYVLK